MKYLSVCSGIEAATVAWHQLGFKPVGFSEIEKFPSQVLTHHYPDVNNYGDMTKYKEWDIGTIDILVGGTPCQSFSVAGLRQGMQDPRGNLALTYCGILNRFKPKWFVWENVPGVLSSNGGRDFGSFLGAVAELGYGFAYRVLDAQNFGVPQRRRRVFVVGCLGDWRRAATVLFERESLCWDIKTSRKKGQDVAKCLKRGVAQRFDSETETMIPAYGIPGNWIGRKPKNGGNAVEPMHNISPCLTKTDGHGVAQPIPLDLRNATRDPEKHDAINRQGVGAGEAGDPAHTVTTACVHGVAQPTVLMDQGGSVMNVMQDGTVGTLRRETHGHEPSILQNMAVRRLTPVECERLQGFPDGYTAVPWRKKDAQDCPDGPRYKALGNSWAVPVVKWLGSRIAKQC